MRRKTGLLVIWFLLAATAAVAAAAPKAAAAEPLAVVRIPARADVFGPDIFLGDIAEIETDDVDLARRLEQLSLKRATMPGHSRDLTMATVRVRMRQQSLPEKQIVIEADEAAVSVATRSRTVSGDSLVEAARAAVLSDARPTGAGADPIWDFAEIVPFCPDPGAITASDGLLELSVSRLIGTPPGPVVASVDVLVNGAVSRTVMVRCDVRVVLDVPVTTAALQRHDVLDEQTVAVERREFTTLPRGLLLPDIVLGGESGGPLRATRPLTAGTVLTESMVEFIPVIARGAQVQIIAGTPGIHVSAPGVALEDGRIGQVIRVENSASGQVIRARVIAPGRVEAAVP